MSSDSDACPCCQANRGQKEILPGGAAFRGRYWQVEHAYPTSKLGWTILRLQRHTEALHELTREEWEEKARLEFAVIQFQRRFLQCEKEYVSCFSEAEGFKHIHVHIAPRHVDSGLDDIGIHSFKHLRPETNQVTLEAIRDYSEALGLELRNSIV